MWRKAMVYLGLGDDAEYDQYGSDYPDEADRAGSRDRAPSARPQASAPVSTYADEPSGIGSVRPISPRSGDPRDAADVGQTVADFLGVPPLLAGTSFLPEVWSDRHPG